MNNYLEHNNLKNLKEDKEIERKIQLILRVGKVLMESGADTNRIVRNMKTRRRIYENTRAKDCKFILLFTTING